MFTLIVAVNGQLLEHIGALEAKHFRHDFNRIYFLITRYESMSQLSYTFMCDYNPCLEISETVQTAVDTD